MTFKGMLRHVITHTVMCITTNFKKLVAGDKQIVIWEGNCVSINRKLKLNDFYYKNLNIYVNK